MASSDSYDTGNAGVLRENNRTAGCTDKLYYKVVFSIHIVMKRAEIELASFSGYSVLTTGVL